MPSKYRENPKRAIYLTEEIDRKLVAKLSPEILKLRLESSDPIFLYIDSLGGSVFFADKLIDLIRAPDQSGNRCEVVSVAFGFAASAAADLLALGNYSIVYPNAMIHYHGTRQSKNEITLEDVQNIAHTLRETNETYALRLASSIFRRLVFRMLMLSLEPAPQQGEQFTFEKGVANPQVFFDQLSSRVSGPTKEIFKAALERQKKLTELVSELTQSEHITADGNKISFDSDVNLLNGIINFEATRLKASSVTALTVEHLSVIQDDFVQLYDFFHGRYRKTLAQIVFERGPSFLAQEELTEYKTISDRNNDEGNAFLLAKVAPRLNPLWHLVVSICRILQKGENPISPQDAYWLGLVDEVVGSPSLMCPRALEEEFAKMDNKPAEVGQDGEGI